MATVNGAHNGINRVLILGDNYASSSITEALSSSNLDVHVAHPYKPANSSDAVTYHIHESSRPLAPLFSNIKPDLIISTASGGSFETQKQIIDSAIEANVPRFIPSEFGQDSLNEKIQERLPPGRERARTIDYLKQKARDERINWVGIATGTPLDRGLLSGNLGFELKWDSATLHGQGNERFASSSSPWTGQVVLAVIEHWEVVRNEYIYASGLPTTANEIIDTFERSEGKRFEVGRADVDECVREAERRFEQGFPDAAVFLMERSVLYDEKMDAVRPFEEKDAKGRLGLKPEQLEDIINGVLHDQEHHGGNPGCGCD